MFILSKKRFQFKNQIGDVCTTKGGMELESIPDWVKDIPFFQAALDDGDIIIATSGSEKDATVAVAKAKAKTAKAKA